MVVTVSGFFNTGFDLVNIPYTSDIITANFTPKTFPDCVLLQNKGISTLKINTTWDEIDGIDYIKIHTPRNIDTYYVVMSIQMLNENVAQLELFFDALTFIGVNALKFSDGWCVRRHVRDDSLFSNILDEPFVPSTELVLDQGKELKLPTGVGTYTDIIGATFNLNGAYELAQQYKVPSSDTNVVVPQVPKFKEYTPPRKPETTINMVIDSFHQYKNTLPNLYLFSLESAKGKLESARSLGLDLAITACYRIPAEYRGTSSSGYVQEGMYDSINNNNGYVNPKLPYEYIGNVLNKKVFALYNNYRLSSICSGDYKEYKADEIYDTTSPEPLFTLWADVSPNGCPYARPRYYRLNNTDYFMECVKGMPWQNTPIAFDTKSGYMFDVAQRGIQLDQQTNAMGGSIVQGISGLGKTIMGGEALSALSSATGIGTNLASQVLSNRSSAIEFDKQQNYRVPEIRFPRDESIQNFLGNTFWVYRTRLSTNDVQRFDKFLSMYGYAVDEPLTNDCFDCRKNYNYVQAKGVSILVNQSRWIRELASKQLEGGVRVWKVPPNPALYTQANPVNLPV